jgi:amino-acid N-acetyltransferase
MTQIRAAAPGDDARIRELLEDAGLPTSDLLSSEPQFIVACEGGRLVGTGALQWFGPAALLRSVAVASALRGRGLGRMIVRDLERLALSAGATQLILLTQTAKDFFERQGYLIVERREVPPEVQASEEFRSLCPASAVCMAKTLAGSS